VAAGPLAAIGFLLDWAPRSATAVAVVAGPLVLLGYLVGSVPFPYLLSRRRLRRQLRGDRPGAADVPTRDDPLDRPGVVAGAVLAALAAVAVATIAWDVALATTPRPVGTRFSAVGIYSDQAIGAWVSVALWTGLAAVVGNMGSVWLRFRGSSGAAPAVALTLVYTPLVFIAAATTFLVVSAVSRRPEVALLGALPVAVTTEYGLWLADVQTGWGVTNGPEVALWVTALAAALFARNVRRALVR
jgi:glycerol-3-phosphate acyltransferase PlsY